MRYRITLVNALLHYAKLDNEMMNPANFLIALMARYGDNPNSLAKKSKATQSTIFRFIEGESKEPRRSTFEKIAHTYKVPVEAFYSDRVRTEEAKRLGILAETSLSEPPMPEYLGRAPEASLIPVAGVAQLGENGWYSEITADGSHGYVEHHTKDPKAYVLRVRGDSMHPAIRNGWYVVVEPSMGLCGGIYVAVALKDGRKMVKELLFENQDEYALESVNGGVRLTIPKKEVLSIHGVAAVVAPGKHKD